MCKKLVLLISVGLVLGLAGGVRAQTKLVVPPPSNHTVSGSETYHEMHVREGGTVTVPSGASLTIEIQGIGGDYGKHCDVDGGTLVVRGDFLCYQGEGRMNTQVEADAHSTILMEGNSYAVTGRFLLGDDPVGSTTMYVRAGTMTIGNLDGGYMTLRGERGVRVYIGGGELIIYNTSTEGDGDPCNWVAQGWLLPDAGYGSVNIEDDYGGIPNCARITATLGAPIAMPPVTPTHGATNVCPEGVVLTWIPGRETQDPNGHNVYFGTNYDDVYEANVAEPCGVLVSYRQDSNTYPEAGSLSLELNRTYYWRVDEVNDNNSSSPWKGLVWSFTTQGTGLSNPFPGNGWKGIAPGSLTLTWEGPCLALTWEGPCLADAYKVYLGEDLPDGISLMDDDFEGPGGFDTSQWDDTTGWVFINAHGDANYGRDSNIVEADGTGEILESNAVDLSDACAFNVRFDVNLTKGLSPSAELQLLYYDGGTFIEVADWNYVDANDHNNAWFVFSRSLTRAEAPQYMINGFKFQLKTVNLDKPVYIDNPRIRNTWPVAGQWFDGQETASNHTILVDPNTRYYWRVDTVIDGNEYRGDTWNFATTMLGGVVFHFDFEGSAGTPLPGTITYGPTNITFNKYASDGNEVRYSSDNGYGLSGYTSADFDWGAGLYRDDVGGPDDFDSLRLDGYQYTIELWIKPAMPPSNEIDEARLIGKDDSWEIMLNDIGPDYESGFEIMWYHGQEAIMRDNIPQLMELAEYGQTEWMHLAAVHNLLAFRKQMLYLNGEVIQTEGDYLFNPSDNNEPVGIACDWDKSGTVDMDDAYVGMIDEVRVLDIALTPDQFLSVPGPEWAGCPNPSHGAIDVDPCDPNVVLSWIPGTEVKTHKVYFSTDFEDVNSSSANALVADLAVEVNSWPAGPDGLTPYLDFGTVYYWRVTEVNGLDTW
ncbi:MAG: LamG-like jellyroll fold domain-containing protein, partial [Planctomycetota bacterium]